MKKSFLLLFIFIALFSLFVLVYQTKLKPAEKSGANVSDYPYRHVEIKINGKVFDAYVSDTAELREDGLSGFAGLTPNEAMLFIFPKPDLYSFWMKDMLFSIDILWLDDAYKVVSFEKNVSPDTFPKSFYPNLPARYVIEFKSGVLDQIALKESDEIFIAGGK